MKQYLPLIFIVGAFFAAVFSIVGDDSYGRLMALKRSLAAQKESNAELESHVLSLRSKVAGLRGSERELEKAARNELGMARPGELIFFFEKKSKTSSKEASVGKGADWPELAHPGSRKQR